MSLTSPKDGDMVGLIYLRNAVTNLVSTMQLLNSDGHLRNPELRQNLAAKLPTTLELQWGEHAQQKRTSDITLANFSTWLTDRADASSIVSDLSGSQTRINTKSSGGKPHFALPQTAIANKPIPTTKKTTNYWRHHYNDVGHLVPWCLIFVSRSDWTESKKKNDASWASTNDTAKECYGRRQRCGTDGCSKRHHPGLHSSSRIVLAAVEVTHTTVHSSTSTTRSQMLLRILPVTLRERLAPSTHSPCAMRLQLSSWSMKISPTSSAPWVP